MLGACRVKHQNEHIIQLSSFLLLLSTIAFAYSIYNLRKYIVLFFPMVHVFSRVWSQERLFDRRTK